jgi:hypothetical protein
MPRPKPPGTVLDDGAPGNCTDLLCDGSGNSMPVANTADLPVDQEGSDCAVPACNGTTVGATALSDGANCGDHQYCLAGQCRQCARDSNCGGDFNICTNAVCDAGTCKQAPAFNGLWCGLGKACSQGKCCSTPGC